MAATLAKKKRSPKRKRLLAPVREPLAFTIPSDAHTLEGFRRWSSSDEFPERGDITFIAGEVWVDMSPERLNSHNKVKAELAGILGPMIRMEDRGEFFIDGARVVHPGADVSREPDALFVSWESYESGLVKLIPTVDEEDYIELEGSVDWVAEVLSPSSEKKDTETLLHRYHLAGIKEYWLIDARGAKIRFMPHQWQSQGFKPIEARGGWYSSPVFGKPFRWRRKKNRINQWTYLLEHR